MLKIKMTLLLWKILKFEDMLTFVFIISKDDIAA
jgi:hypothetical protein